MSPPNSCTRLHERIVKLKKTFYNSDDDDDFLFCIKFPLSDIIAFRV